MQIDLEAELQSLRDRVSALEAKPDTSSSAAASIAEFEGRIQAVEAFVAETKAVLKGIGSAS